MQLVLALLAPAAIVHQPPRAACCQRVAPHRVLRVRCAAADPRLEELPSLQQFVQSVGGSADGVRGTVTTDMGLGLESSRPVKRGDVLLSVPLSVGISAESALRSPELGTQIAQFEPLLAEYSIIAVMLMVQRFLGEASPLFPWLSSSALPLGGFADLPLVWQDADKAELAKSTTMGFEERLADLTTDFEWLEENVFSSAPMQFPPFVFTLAAFNAALALSLSRSIPVPLDQNGAEVQLVMLPLLDMVNHDPAPSTALRLRSARSGFFGAGASDASVELVALQDMPEGAALTRQYSRGDVGAELLIDHGFIEQRVPASAMLSFELEDEDDVNLDDKLDCLERNGLSDCEFWVVAEEQCATEGLPTELMAFLRLKHLTGTDAFLLESIFADSLWSEHLQLPVSEENERLALQDALGAVQTQLDGMPSSLQLDLQILGEAAQSSNAYMMASVRYAERRALQEIIRWLEGQLLRVDSLEFYQDRRLNSLGLNPIESDEELEALKAAGRSYGASDVEW